MEEFEAMQAENRALSAQIRALTTRVTTLEITKAELAKEVQAAADYVTHLSQERAHLLMTTSKAIQSSKIKERNSVAKVRDMEKVLDRQIIQLRVLKSVCSRLQNSLQKCSTQVSREDDVLVSLARELVAKQVVELPPELTARRHVMK